MKVLASLAGGLAGAITVTLLHEVIRKIDPSAPRLDLVGQKATEKLVQRTGHKPPTGNNLYATSLAGSLIANTLSYSLAGMSGKPLSVRTLMSGATMGLGAVTLPDKLGLNGHHVKDDQRKKWMTVMLYIAGGLVASAVARRVEKRKKKRIVSPYKAPDEAWKPVLDIMV